MSKLYGISRRLYDDAGKEIHFTHGEGSYIYDNNNKEYIDMILGYGPMILGHGNSEFAAHVNEVILKGNLFPSYGKIQMELAEDINKCYPEHSLISVYQSGSDSIDAAVRICRTITGKQKYIRLGYIGWLDNLLEGGLYWHEPLNSKMYNQLSHKNLFGGSMNVYNWHDGSMETLIRICEKKDAACIILDAYQIQRRSSLDLNRIASICRNYNILMVLDETKTSGRICPYGYYKDKCNFDYTIVGKAISNGIPTSLLIGKEKYDVVNYDKLKIAGTYARDNLSCSSVLCTKDIMRKNHNYAKIGKIGLELSKKLNSVINATDVCSEIYVNSLLKGSILEFSYSYAFANDYSLRKKFAQILIENGLIIPDGHCFYICLEHEHNLAEIEKRFRKSICDIEGYFSNSQVV